MCFSHISCLWPLRHVWRFYRRRSERSHTQLRVRKCGVGATEKPQSPGSPLPLLYTYRSALVSKSPIYREEKNFTTKLPRTTLGTGLARTERTSQQSKLNVNMSDKDTCRHIDKYMHIPLRLREKETFESRTPGLSSVCACRGCVRGVGGRQRRAGARKAGGSKKRKGDRAKVARRQASCTRPLADLSIFSEGRALMKKKQNRVHASCLWRASESRRLHVLSG